MDDADRAQTLIDERIERQLAAVRRANAEAEPGDRPALRICTGCEDPIEAARLAARPNARRCIHCQEAAERRARNHRRSMAA